MTDPEKLATDIVGQYANVYSMAYLPKLTAEVATALRAARNEGLEEGAALCEWAVETAGLPETQTFAGDTRSNVRRAALALASAIRSKKDSGNG